MDKGSINKVQLIGRLTADPELKHTTGGTACCSVSIATTTSYKGQDGNYIDKPEYHRCVFWQKNAENLVKYVKKGYRLYVEGRLETRTWEKDGVKHYTTEIIVAEMQFLESKHEAKPENEIPLTSPQGSDSSGDNDSQLPF